MAEVTIAEGIEIAAPPEAVYDYRLDFTTLPAYNPHVSNMRRTDGGTELGTGAEYAFDLQLPGATEPIESPLRVLDARRPSMVTLETGPGFMAREVCTFDATEAGTRVIFEQTITLEGDLPEDTLKAIGDSAGEQAKLELELMKKNLEG